MSIYNFAPMPSLMKDVSDFATWENGFTSEELDSIIEYGEKQLPLNKATLTGVDSGLAYENVRSSSTSWLSHNNDTAWLYDRLANIARTLNAYNWRYDLSGFVEDFQYTLYDKPDDHYTWHVDTQKNRDGVNTRKLSMVIQLSDPYEYEGGELQLKVGPNNTVIPKQLGMITVFPSFELHRVTPLISGTRRSLVVWISGPPFK